MLTRPNRSADAPVVVEVGPAGRGEDAVRWAAEEAWHRGTDLHLVLPDADRHLAASRDAIAEATAAAVAVAPDVDVAARPTTDSPLRAEQVVSGRAAVLVVAGPTPQVDELIMTVDCPVVLVPPDGKEPAKDAPVVVAVGPATGPEVLAFAFSEAAAHGAPVLAVRAWSDPLVDLGRLLPGRIARWDAADRQARNALARQLSAAAMDHPDVRIDTLVVNDSCTETLATLGHRARLLVLGRPARGALLGGIAPSPAVALARRPPCPVVVVPPPGPSHGWLPRRPVGLADLMS